MGADGRDRGLLLVGVVNADTGEDVQGVLPVGAGLLVPVQRVVGVGEPVVGASLVLGLAQFAGEREGLGVVGEGDIGMAGGMV